MALISQETWDNFSEEKKEKIRNAYETSPTNAYKRYLEQHYGKENLQPNSNIKTWVDIKKKYNITKEYAYNRYIGDEPDCCGRFIFNSSTFCMKIQPDSDTDFNIDSKIINKMLATAKISKIIEEGYGGMVTEEEWKNAIEIWYIDFDKDNNPLVCLRGLADSNKICPFIAFHTKQQAEEFMSYPENVELIRQYHMI